MKVPVSAVVLLVPEHRKNCEQERLCHISDKHTRALADFVHNFSTELATKKNQNKSSSER